MRIAIVHSFYRGSSPSGENVLVRRQVEELVRRGHEVRLIARESGHDPAPLEALKGAAVVATGLGPQPLSELRAFRPDVTHVHNLFPQFADRWLRQCPSPVVLSLHNFRLVCAAAILFRDGHRCTDCGERGPLAGLRHGCYRGSRTATAALTIAQLRRRDCRTLVDAAAVVTVPSRRSRDQFAALGVDTGRFTILPVGVDVLPGAPAPPPAEPRWLASGRLVEEKGFLQLARAWPRDIPLTIRGDGPQSTALRAVAGPNVRLEPAVEPERHIANLGEYAGFVFPSLWQETQGLAALEALARGVPVIARADTAVSDLVAGIDPRWVYRDTTGLSAAIDAVYAGGMAAREVALDHARSTLTTQHWIDALEQIYLNAVGGAA